MYKIDNINKSNTQKILLSCFNLLLKENKIDKFLLKNVNFKNNFLSIVGEKIFIKDNLYLAGWGKLSPYLAYSFAKLVGVNNIRKGLFISNRKTKNIKNIKFLKGSHPLPNLTTFNSSYKMLNFLKSISSDSHLIFLISGGGSSQFSIPAGGISFTEKKMITQKMITAGVQPKVLNNIRKFTSKVKGGKLIKFLNVKKIFNIIVSDENQNLFHSIASGATILQKWDFKKINKDVNLLSSKNIISKNILNKIKRLIKGHEIFQKNNPIKEKLTFSSNQKKLILNQKTLEREMIVKSQIIFNNLELRKSLQKIIKKKTNKKVLLNKEFLFGDYEENKKKILYQVRKNRHKNFFLIFGTQIEINISKKKNFKKTKGGRIQHLCLDLALELRKEKLLNYEISGIASDGDDFLKNVSGATLSKKLISQFPEKNIDNYLKNFSSFKFHKKNKSLIFTKSPTENNVMDIIVLYINKKNQ